MSAVDFPFYQATMKVYKKITNTDLDENLIKGLTILKCIRKIVKWKNSPEKMIKALKYLL